jgi:DNA-binding CsgD family transcriptional regulator
MLDSNHYSSPLLKTAHDVETWHPDLEILVRYDIPFVCLDRAESTLHVSPGATALLAQHDDKHLMLARFREAARAAFAADEAPRTLATPRVITRVTDPIDGSHWAVHTVRTRHEWPIAIVVREGIQMANRETILRERLSERERQVATMVAAGAPGKEIAEALSITYHTARRHTEHVYRKLGVRSRVELTRALMQQGVAH